MNDSSLESTGETIRNKIVIVGDVFVGKTSIMNKFVENVFKEAYDPTIGVDFYSKILHFKGKNIVLQIWDTAGQEKYKSLIPSYVRGASIIYIVYDVSKKESFFNISTWINFVKSIKTESTIIVLCGNKIDLKREVSLEEAEQLSNKENLLYFETSAKTNENIKNMLLFSLTELPFFEQFKIDKQKLIIELGIFMVKKEEENKEIVESYQTTGLTTNTNQLVINDHEKMKENEKKRSLNCKC